MKSYYKILIDTDDDVAGTIISLTDNGTIYTSQKTFYSKYEVENSPHLFQQLEFYIKPKIISFIDGNDYIYYLNSDDKYDPPLFTYSIHNIKLETMMEYVKGKLLKIYQVAINDDIIYTLGDLLNEGIISDFIDDNDNGIVAYMRSNIERNVQIHDLYKLNPIHNTNVKIDVNIDENDNVQISLFKQVNKPLQYINVTISSDNLLPSYSIPTIISFVDKCDSIYYLNTDGKYDYNDLSLNIYDMKRIDGNMKIYQILDNTNRIYMIGDKYDNKTISYFNDNYSDDGILTSITIGFIYDADIKLDII